MAISDLIWSPVARARSAVASVAWTPCVGLSQSLIMSLLVKIETGQLRVVDQTGAVTVCGRADVVDGEPHTEIRIHKETFWVRMLLFTDMGFAESYMLGEVSCPDLTSFFELFIRNRQQLSNGTNITSSLSSSLAGLARSTNTLANARLNISAHYDISNEMFAAFLSDDMTYSCALWAPKSSPKAPHESLEHAQATKLARFIQNAHINQSDHVLEIGTGWGSFAIAAVRATGCRITSVTLSVEQKALAEKRITEAGLTERIEVLLCDYRAIPVPKPEGHYDKIVSIEMLEAVGSEFLETYFACIDRLLKPAGGIAVFQCITIPEPRYDAAVRSVDFIKRYIFPGGHLPCVSQLVAACRAGARNRLVVDSVVNIGPHYARTLRVWRDKFMANFDARIRPALLNEHRGMTDGDVDLFRRKWEYYFTYCEAGFRTCTLGDVIMTVSREGTVELADDVIL